MLRAQSGTVRVFGLDPVDNPVGTLGRIGYLSEDRDLPDWMRVGELLLNEGTYEGNELMPPRYGGLVMTPTHKESPRGLFTRVDGSFADKVIWLDGSSKQRLWIVPSLRLTVLRIGDDPSSGWDEAMIPDSIIRGTSGWHPPLPGADVDPNKFAPH